MSPEIAARRRRLALRLAAAALVWSVGLLLTALLVPLYGGQTSSDANGLTLFTATYVQRFGGGTLVPLALPAVAAVLALIAIARADPRRRRAAEALTVLSGLAGVVFVVSGGVLLLLPAALTAAGLRLVGAGRRRGPRQSAVPGNEGA